MTAILDIELVRTFHTVARLGKFSAAATQLHKSPAAISVHIQRLETIAGGRLLNRDNQSVSLTTLGKRLLMSSTELLSTHDRVMADLQGTRLAGRITLGVPDEYASHVIRDILPGFVSARPNVVIELKTASSITLRDDVLSGKLQAAVVAVADVSTCPKALVLTPTRPVWVGPATSSIGLDDPVPLAVHATQCPYRQAMIDALKRTGRPFRIVLESPSNQAVKACVEAGLAISVIDRARVTDAMQILQSFPVIQEYQLVFLQSASSAGDDALTLLSTLLLQHFRL